MGAERISAYSREELWECGGQPVYSWEELMNYKLIKALAEVNIHVLQCDIENTIRKLFIQVCK